MTKKILITGFLPFDSDQTNPSGDWIDWMASKRREKDDREIRGVILPVSFGTAFRAFKDIYDEFSPDIVILTGLAKNRKDLTVERIGINWIDARIPDNDGVTIKSQKINSEGPDGLFTTIDIDQLITLAEKESCMLKLSTSAGEYVCNDLLYKVLYYLKDKNSKATFIHLPGLDNYSVVYNALKFIVNNI